MSKIQYQPLEKTLNMLCKVEITEKTILKDEYFINLFNVEIFPHKTSFWSGNQNIEIIRKPISLNNLPNNNAEALAQQVSAALHQLTLQLNLNGLPTTVEKQNGLWQKWLSIRGNLTDTFTGNWVESALTEIDMKMLPGETLIHDVMQDLFLNEYFRNIYDAPFIENIFHCKRTVYGLCPFSIQFNEKWSLQTSATKQLIKFSGKWDKITDQPAFDYWLKTKTDDHINEIRINGFYQLDYITGWCNALESSYVLATNNYKKTLTITLTSN